MFAYILPTEPQNSKSPFSFVIKVENKWFEIANPPESELLQMTFHYSAEH